MRLALAFDPARPNDEVPPDEGAGKPFRDVARWLGSDRNYEARQPLGDGGRLVTGGSGSRGSSSVFTWPPRRPLLRSR